MKSETRTYLACLLIALVFIGSAICDTLTKGQHRNNPSQVMLVSAVSSKDILQGRSLFLGNADAPYTLVEFGDYECPPCRNAQKIIGELLEQYAGKVKLDFRHYPLQRIHPGAVTLARYVEFRRIQGKDDFWNGHKTMFIEGRANSLPKVPEKYRATIEKRIEEDTALARRLRVISTPSFFLCRPDGKVFRLADLSAIQNVL